MKKKMMYGGTKKKKMMYGGKKKMQVGGAKPDYLDFDKDGNKKESMKSALKNKKKKEQRIKSLNLDGFPKNLRMISS